MKESLFYAPLHILEEINDSNGSEMSQYDLAFICYLVKKYKPKKILEVGVAAGGTTTVIMNCCRMLELDTTIHSVDIMEYYYRDTSKKTGYLAEKFAKDIIYEKFYMYRNTNYLKCNEQIGNDIDMVILDTAHSLPGELLDFLSCFPALKEGTVVVLHDILLNHLGNQSSAYATKLLLDVVVAKKIVSINLDNIGNFPNIAAFVITEDTKKYISDIFSALTITWKYMPDKNYLECCKEFFIKHYSEEECNMFTRAIELNKTTILKQEKRTKEIVYRIENLIKVIDDKEIYIYGYGFYGKMIYDILNKGEDIRFKSFIVSDNQKIEDVGDVSIKHLGDVLQEIKGRESIVLVAVSRSAHKEIKNNLSKYEIDNIYFVNDVLELVFD